VIAGALAAGLATTYANLCGFLLLRYRHVPSRDADRGSKTVKGLRLSVSCSRHTKTRGVSVPKIRDRAAMVVVWFPASAHSEGCGDLGVRSASSRRGEAVQGSSRSSRHVQDLARAMQAGSRFRYFAQSKMPHAMPASVSGLKSSITLAVGRRRGRRIRLQSGNRRCICSARSVLSICRRGSPRCVILALLRRGPVLGSRPIETHRDPTGSQPAAATNHFCLS